VSEIKKRHVASPLDGATEVRLRQSGAHPELIAALKDNANVLTAEQASAYADFTNKQRVGATGSEKSGAASGSLNSDRELSQPVGDPGQPTSHNVEDRVTANERAEEDYHAKKLALEKRIVVQESAIDRLRTFGNNESAIATATAELESYKQQLANLPPPAFR
jgi:hypothetical protein